MFLIKRSDRASALAFILATFLFLPQAVQAHEGRIIGDYRIAVGHRNEPAFVSAPNAFDLFATRITGVDKPINASEGDTVDLEIYVQFCGTDNFNCGNNWVKLEEPEQVRGTENRYNSPYVPSHPGVYAFRITGTVADSDPQGAPPLELVDEIFICGEGSLSSESSFGCVEQPLVVPEPTAANPFSRAFTR